MGKRKKDGTLVKYSAAPTIEAVLLVLIVLIAAAVRLGPLMTNPEVQRNGYGQFGDTEAYHRLAVNLLRGNGFSTTDDGSAFGGRAVSLGRYEPAITRPPIYPLFLAAVYSFVGSANDSRLETWRRRWDAARFAQSVLDALVCVMVFLLAKSMTSPSRWAPLVAAGVYAASPYNRFYTRALLSESLGTFLLVAALLACVFALKRGRTTPWLVAGVLLGVAALCLPQLMLFPFMLAGWLVWRARFDRREGVKVGIACVTGAVIAIAPWTIRNLAVFRQPVPISIGATGYQLFLGTFETKANWRGWEVLPEPLFPDPHERAAIGALTDTLYEQLNSGSIKMAETNRRFQTLALREMRAHPGRTLATWVESKPRLWYQNYIKIYRDREASGVFVLLYFMFAIFALLRASGMERSAMMPGVLLAVYLTLIFLPLHVEPRYSVVAMPGLIAVAGAGFVRFLGGLRSMTARSNRGAEPK